MPEIARCNTIEIGQPLLRASSQIEACHQFEQPMISAIRDRDRQWFLVERFDMATDEAAQQSAQCPLLRLVLAQRSEFLLKDFEGCCCESHACKSFM
jgi:hypothetical protein